MSSGDEGSSDTTEDAAAADGYVAEGEDVAASRVVDDFGVAGAGGT